MLAFLSRAWLLNKLQNLELCTYVNQLSKIYRLEAGAINLHTSVSCAPQHLLLWALQAWLEVGPRQEQGLEGEVVVEQAPQA